MFIQWWISTKIFHETEQIEWKNEKDSKSIFKKRNKKSYTEGMNKINLILWLILYFLTSAMFYIPYCIQKKNNNNICKDQAYILDKNQDNIYEN